MPAPLVEKLNELKKTNPVPFHMPGHKRKREFVPDDLFGFDITEIDGFDNLHNPEGVILESEKLCAKLFGADKTFYLVNGTTSGVMASVLSVCDRDDKIIIARNCHKSVYNAVLLAGAVPVYVTTKTTFFGTSGVVSPDDVRSTIEENSNVKAVVITNPNYEGFCTDVQKIAEITHEKGIPLIVDEAHGSHLKFSDKFPKDALSCGADIVIQSLHKTLPVLTQSSVLHLKSNLIDENRLKTCISMFTSTSPSYILMAVIDNCQNLLSEQANELFKKYTENLDFFYENTKDLRHIKIITKTDILGKNNVVDVDFGKIICLCGKKNIINVENSLKTYYNINVEMKGTEHILFMTSLCDEKSDFEKLINALKEIDDTISDDFSFDEKKSSPKSDLSEEKPVCVLSPSKAFYSKKEKVPFEDSMGLISGEFIIPYPPGIPLVAPGELITSEIIQKVREYQKYSIEINGCEDNKLVDVNVII